MAQGEEDELLPHIGDRGSPPATSAQMENFVGSLIAALDRAAYFQPAHRREVMERNLRNIFLRQGFTEQDMRTLHGVLTSLGKDR